MYASMFAYVMYVCVYAYYCFSISRYLTDLSSTSQNQSEHGCIPNSPKELQLKVIEVHMLSKVKVVEDEIASDLHYITFPNIMKGLP